MRPFHRIIRDEEEESAAESKLPERIIAMCDRLEAIWEELDCLPAPRSAAYVENAIACLKSGDR
jgi:hypothetical protein